MRATRIPQKDVLPTSEDLTSTNLQVYVDSEQESESPVNPKPKGRTTTTAAKHGKAAARHGKAAARPGRVAPKEPKAPFIPPQTLKEKKVLRMRLHRLL